MKLNIIIAAIFMSLPMFIASCRKNIAGNEIKLENYATANNDPTLDNDASPAAGAIIRIIPLSLTVYNPCCEEEVRLTGIIHRVENSNVIHMDSRNISGIGLASGLNYTVQSTSVRNYQFDPNDYLATLNWSIRMMGENGCGYNVQFVIHITRDANGEIIANIHSGNFFCL